MPKNGWRESAQKVIFALCVIFGLVLSLGAKLVYAEQETPTAPEAQWNCGTTFNPPPGGVVSPGQQIETVVSCSKSNPEAGYIALQATGAQNINTWDTNGVTGCVKRQSNEVFCKNRDQGGTILRLRSIVTAPSSGSFTQSGNYQIDEGLAFVEVKANYIVSSDDVSQVYLPLIVR